MPEDLLNFGLIPEFIGRLPVLSAVHQLKREDLVQILTEPKNALVKQYQRFFNYDNIDLVFTDDALWSIADKALDRETGARGLRSIIENALLDVMFELPSRKDVSKCVITKETIEKGLKPTLVTSAGARRRARRARRRVGLADSCRPVGARRQTRRRTRPGRCAHARALTRRRLDAKLTPESGLRFGRTSHQEDEFMRHRFTKVLLGVASSPCSRHGDGCRTVALTRRRSYNVGIVYSRTGLLAAYGAEELEGFKYGLQYATNGTARSTARRSTSPTSTTRPTPATGVTAAKDLIGQGYKIIDGHRLVGCRIAGRPARRAEPRALHLRPRGRRCDHRRQQVHLPRRPPDASRTCYDGELVPRQGDRQEGRRLRPGLGVRPRQLRRGQGGLGGKGHNVTEVSVPLTATDFTPFAQQAKNANPDLLFVAWAGTTAGAMWKALDQQNVFTGDADRHRPRRAGDLGDLR